MTSPYINAFNGWNLYAQTSMCQFVYKHGQCETIVHQTTLYDVDIIAMVSHISND